jgi:cytochrome c oxidase subunit II
LLNGNHLLPAMTLVLIPALSGCEGIMSALDPQGPAAREIALIWWVMFWASVVLVGGTMALLLYAILRRPERRVSIGSGMPLIIAGGVALPLVLILPLLIYGVGLGALQSTAQVPAALSIEVIGHRFWWEVRYEDPEEPGAVVVSANEIHIPAGVAVDFTLRSEDVIHGFWIPNLGGKLDMIPGRANRIRLQADRPGLFRGQCAEFCGPQHARMAFLVRAHPPEEFRAWLARERGPAREPDSELLLRGREAFMDQGCMECHTIRGTGARGREGPDLTRVGGRMTLGAGTLENDAEQLAYWIADNQRIKPGNRMLPFDRLEPETLKALAAYLESLE